MNSYWLLLVNLERISHCLNWMNKRLNLTTTVLPIQNIHTVIMIITSILIETFPIQLILLYRVAIWFQGKKNIKSSLLQLKCKLLKYRKYKNYLYVLRHPFDVFVISETWVHDLNVNCFPLQGMKLCTLSKNIKEGEEWQFISQNPLVLWKLKACHQ